VQLVELKFDTMQSSQLVLIVEQVAEPISSARPTTAIAVSIPSRPAAM
jgi:hypothetical protein